MQILSKKHIQAARLIWEGKAYQDVAIAVDSKESTVKSWMTYDIFKDEIERLTREKQEQNRNEIDETVAFQAKLREDTRKFYELCSAKISDSIKQIELDSATHRSIPPLVKAQKDLAELVLHVDDATLGLEQLARELDGISKAQG